MTSYKISFFMAFLFIGGMPYLFSQKEDYVWMLGFNNKVNSNDSLFGTNIIDFHSGKIRLTERRDFISKFDRANASICDSLGNLVCYTNGLEIYNNKHEIIANGNGINPGEFHDNYKDFGYNLNQGTIILAWPNKKGVYVLFHAIETLEDDSFYLGYDLLHTVIDMNKFNGKGFVTSKNMSFFHDTICPVGNFTACRHANGRDWWLLFAEWNSNRMHRFLFDPSGIHHIGMQELPHILYSVFGQTKFSPNGLKYLTFYFTDFGYRELHLLDFDRCSGLLSDHKRFLYPYTNSIGTGCEISENSRFLYLFMGTEVRQIDLSDPSTYSKGEVILVTDKYGWPFEFFYSMGARAPDGKIYFNSTNTSSTLNVIHHPNKKSSACEIKPHDFPILFNRTMVNFPNFNLGRMIGSACDTIGIVSVKEVQNHDTHEMMIYPNPSYDDINLELWNRDKNISEITIMDIQGKVIRHETNQKTTFKFKINISDLSSGLYLVKVKDQHGKTYSGKMVKN